METQDIPEIRRKRHKTDFFAFNKNEGRPIKPKRLSCMNASEYFTMEESKISIINLCIEEIIVNVFDEINKAKISSELCLKQVQKKTELVRYFDLYNMGDSYQQHAHIIHPGLEPKTQPKHRVIVNKDKNASSLFVGNKKEFLGDQNKINDNLNPTHSRSNSKLTNKQKSNRESHFALKVQSNSMKSLKSSRGNSSMLIGLKANECMNEQMSERSRQKQKKRKQEIIKKLLQEHQQKLKDISHPGPEPIMQQYRAFFTQSETREQQDFRNSFLYLRQIKQSQENIKHGKLTKKALNRSIFTESESKQNLNVKLPTIFSPINSNSNRNKNQPTLFAQDQNGSVINVKHSEQFDSPMRQHSSTTHEGIIKRPQESKFKQISANVKHKIERIPNPKLKPQSQVINENASIISTLCQSVDEDMLERQIQNGGKNGVTLKRSMSSHRISKLVEDEGLKLPSLYSKK